MVRGSVLIMLLICIGSCAQMRSPAGGPVDTDAPVPVAFQPEILSTHFNQSQFTISFDEYVQLKNLQSQLIVSPPLKSKPTATLKGKNLTISWKDTLQSNTTYLFNFGNAIVDLNEGNSATGLIYVFSTGDFIDSLEFKGGVKEAFTNQPVTGMAVMLYEGEHDSLPATVKPNYVAMTDSAGNFSLRYLREGNYKIFALQDKNGNYLYDLPAEAIAFDTNRVAPMAADSMVSQNTYFSFTNTDTAQYIKSFSTTDYGRITLTYNLPVTAPELELQVKTGGDEGSLVPYVSYLSESGDSLVAWATPASDVEAINIISSDGTIRTDTSFWYRELNEKYSDKPELGLSGNLNKGRMGLQQIPTFSTQNPIDTIIKESIKLMEDSVQIPFSLNISDSIRRTFQIEATFKPDVQYTLFFRDSSITDIYGATNDSLQFKFQLQDKLYYGRLALNVNLDSVHADQVVIQLWQDKKLIKEEAIQNSRKLNYPFLAPGTYKVKAIFDTNMDGKWTTGDYKSGRQPELVDWLPQEISIRSNWDLEQEWQPQPPFPQ